MKIKGKIKKEKEHNIIIKKDKEKNDCENLRDDESLDESITEEYEN